MFKFLNKDFQVMKEDKQYYEACLKRIDNNLKHFYQMLLNQQEWHQTIGVRMGALEEKINKIEGLKEPLQPRIIKRIDESLNSSKEREKSLHARMQNIECMVSELSNVVNREVLPEMKRAYSLQGIDEYIVRIETELKRMLGAKDTNPPTLHEKALLLG